MQHRIFSQKNKKKKRDIIHNPTVLRLNQNTTCTFNYLNHNHLITINSIEIPRLIQDGDLVSVQQTVCELDFTPDLTRHGFEYRALPADITQLLAGYNQANEAKQSLLRENIREKLERLVSGHYGLRAVALDAVYRNTATQGNTTFKNLPLVHADFASDEMVSTLKTFTQQWKPRVCKALSEDYYYPDKIAFMLNIWMPLATAVAFPLAICSRQIPASRLVKYDAVRRDGEKFKAVSATRPQNEDRWHYVPGMAAGTCFMFFSTRTPHTAISIPHEKDSLYPDRQSIEVRLLVSTNKFSMNWR